MELRDRLTGSTAVNQGRFFADLCEEFSTTSSVNRTSIGDLFIGHAFC